MSTTAPTVKRADVRAYIGATGTGKGVSIVEHLKAEKPDRLVIFDPMHEYGPIARPVSSVAEMLRAMQAKRYRIAWQPPDGTDYSGKRFKADFEIMCKACFIESEAAPVTMLVEELELVTKPAWAPPAWRDCTKRGRHRGLRIVAASQRPADCDKAFLSSCTFVRVFALREHDDRARVAKALNVPMETMDGLRTIADGSKTIITCYEKDFSDGSEGLKTITLRR